MADVSVPTTPTNPAPKPGDRVRVNDLGTHHDAVGNVLHREDDVMLVVKLDGIAGKWLYADDELDVLPTVPATQDDLREQVANALAGSNLREVGDDGTLVRPFAAKSPMAFAYADAALSVVAPVLEGLRVEVERLTNVGRVEASAKADAMITADVWKHRHDNVLRELEQKRGESGWAELLHEVEQWRATFGETALRDATAIIAERDTLRAERDRERESRIAWALEADRLDQVAERATHLAGRVLSEFIQKGYPGGPSVRTGWVGADTVAAWHRELAELSRPSVSDQTSQPISLPRAHQIAQEIAKEAEARRSALAEREAASDQTADLTGLAAREDTR